MKKRQKKRDKVNSDIVELMLNFVGKAQQSASGLVREHGQKLADEVYLYQHDEITLAQLIEQMQKVADDFKESVASAPPDRTPDLHETEFALSLAKVALMFLPLLL